MADTAMTRIPRDELPEEFQVAWDVSCPPKLGPDLGVKLS